MQYSIQAHLRSIIACLLEVVIESLVPAHSHDSGGYTEKQQSDMENAKVEG
jgi:hypothetical protein